MATFPDDVFIADNHFSWARDHRDEFPKTVANFPAQKGGDVATAAGAANATKERSKYNAAVAHARARVESAFGEIKRLWKALSEPWAEGDAQLDCLF
jgi:hypothetical protein